jgi:hypothetical protein
MPGTIHKTTAIAIILIATLGPSLQIQGIQRSVADLPTHRMRCQPTSKVVCESGSCKSIEPTTFILLGERKGEKIYSRCDRNGCDHYEAQSSISGIYDNWQLSESRGVVFKRAVDNSEFIEVATLGLQAYLSWGACKPFEQK